MTQNRMLVHPAQPDSALSYARSSGLKEGDRVLVNLTVGATVSPPAKAGELVTTARVVTLHFCSSGWKILDRLCPSVPVTEGDPLVNVVGGLPQGLPPMSFIDGEFDVTLKDGRLHLIAPPIIRAAAIPVELHERAPWAHAAGRREVFEFDGRRSFADWIGERAEVVRN